MLNMFEKEGLALPSTNALKGGEKGKICARQAEKYNSMVRRDTVNSALSKSEMNAEEEAQDIK